jgi:hypothetical protein
MNKLMRLVTIVFVLVSLLAFPSLARAVDYDANGNPIEPVAPPPVLLVDGNPVMPEDVANPVINLTGAGAYSLSATTALPYSITIQGTGSWQLAGPINMDGQLTVLQGSFDTRSYQLDCGSFYIGEYDTPRDITVTLGSSTVNTFAFAIRGKGVNFDAGDSTINTTLLFDDTDRAGHQYSNVNIKSKDGVYGYIEGSSSFKDLKMDSPVTYLDTDIAASDLVVQSGAIKPNVKGTETDKTVSVDIANPLKSSISIAISRVETVVTDIKKGLTGLLDNIGSSFKI